MSTNSQIHRLAVSLKRNSDFWRRFKRRKLAIFGLAVLVFMFLFAATSFFVKYPNPLEITGPPLQAPTLSHLFGTDNLGRDMLSRTVTGARVSLEIGLFAALTSAVLGTLIGSVSGFSGGLIDDLLMRITDTMLILPKFFIALIVVVLFGSTVLNVTLVIGFLSWPTIARLVRGEYLSLKERGFVEAARSLGSKKWDLMIIEILPNAMTALVVATSLQVGQAILTESALAFLGLGDPNAPSWGLLLNDAQPFLENAYWTSLFPGLFLALTILAVNLVGDGLNDAMNPALKER